MAGSRVLPNDVLLNITGASIGRVCVVPKDLGPANVNQHVTIIRLSGALLPEFIAYHIASPGFQKFIDESQAGATRQALTKVMIENFRIPAPPLHEQQRIAAILRERLATVERARAATSARRQAANLLPAACLRLAFEKKVLQKWPTRPLGESADLLPSKSIALAGDADVRTITSACLSERGFLPSGVKEGRMWKDDALDCKVAVGEVLVSRSNTQERVGRASMYMGDPPDVVSSDLTIRIWPQQVTSAFLTRYLSYLYLTGYWEERSGGASSTMKKITRQQVLAVRVPVPSAETQRSITTALDDRMDSIASLQGALATEKHAIEALIPGLMGRAFRGEL